jgi:hypothetical protein
MHQKITDVEYIGDYVIVANEDTLGTITIGVKDSTIMGGVFAGVLLDVEGAKIVRKALKRAIKEAYGK